MSFIALVLDAYKERIEIMDTNLTPAELEEIHAITAEYHLLGARAGPKGTVRDELPTLSDNPIHEKKVIS
jgi:hypothetical protein